MRSSSTRWFWMAVATAALSSSCDKFDSPPEIAVIGLKDGRLADSKAPIDLAFSEPVDPASLSVKIVRLQTDGEGNLEGDPGAAPGTVSQLLFTYPTNEEVGGTGLFSEGNTRFRINVNEKLPLPVGPSMAVIIEPGLRDLAGVDTKVRRRIPFGYGFSCTGKTPSGPFTTGQYFFLVSVLNPLGLQVQLVASIEVDPVSGAFRGRFTNGDRIPDPNRCPTPAPPPRSASSSPSPGVWPPPRRPAPSRNSPIITPTTRPPRASPSPPWAAPRSSPPVS
jgi:hypothetical protein